MSWRRSREGGRVLKNGYRAVLCRWKSNDPPMMCKAVFIIIPTAPLKKKNQRLENDNTSLVWRRGGGVTLYVQSNIVYIHFISFSLFTDFRWRNDDPGCGILKQVPFFVERELPGERKGSETYSKMPSRFLTLWSMLAKPSNQTSSTNKKKNNKKDTSTPHQVRTPLSLSWGSPATMGHGVSAVVVSYEIRAT